MLKQDSLSIVKGILIEQFDIAERDFHWDIPLQLLNEDFELLSVLSNFEKSLSTKVNIKIPMVENISATFHTPTDIVNLLDKFYIMERKNKI